MKFVLDTDTLSHIYRGNSKVIERMRNAPGKVLGTTIITKVEILQGRFSFLMKASKTSEFLRAQELLTKTELFLSRIKILSLGEPAIREFQRLREIKGLQKIGRADLLIASITLAYEGTLVSRNLRHFQRVPDLKLINWVD